MKKKMARTLAVLMCLMTAVAFMPTFAFATTEEPVTGTTSEAPAVEQQEPAADEPAAEAGEESGTPEMTLQEEPKPGETVNVYITVSNSGALATDNGGKVMAQRELEVTDIDGDGHFTYDEALIAAHKKYNAEDGYATTDSPYGKYVTKLWGETKTFLFFVNDKAIASGVGDDEVADGDYLNASVNLDDKYSADWYIHFNKKTVTVAQNESFQLEVKGCQGMAYPFATKKIDKEKSELFFGTQSGSAFNPLEDVSLDGDSKIELKFSDAGVYYITAEGAVKDTVTDWSVVPPETIPDIDCPVIAPACKVIVRDAGEAGEAIAAFAQKKKDAINKVSSSFDSSKYRAAEQIAALTAIIKANVEINLAEDEGAIDKAVNAAAAYIAALMTDEQYKNVEYYTSYKMKLKSVSAGKKKATVKWTKATRFDSYQIYYKKANADAKYVTVGSDTASKVIKKLSKKKKYSFKIRGIKTLSNDKAKYGNKAGIKVYGSWSSAKSKKIK